MKEVTITSTSGHVTSLTMPDDAALTLKKALNKGVSFYMNFDNGTFWINPKNIYFIHIEDVKEKIK